MFTSIGHQILLFNNSVCYVVYSVNSVCYNNVFYVNSPGLVFTVNSPCQDLTACHHVYIFVLLDTFCTKLCWTYTEISATISTLFSLVYRIQLTVQ